MQIEQLLDKTALDILNKQDTREEELVSSSDFEIDKYMRFDSSKIYIGLPGTNKIEPLEFIPTKELPISDEILGPAAEPKFIYPKEKFDIFEHYSFEWIPVPEFED